MRLLMEGEVLVTQNGELLAAAEFDVNYETGVVTIHRSSDGPVEVEALAASYRAEKQKRKEAQWKRGRRGRGRR